MKKLVMLIIAAGIGYAAYTTPDFNAHKDTINDMLQDPQYYTEDQDAERFSDLDFSNFLVASVTKDTIKMTLVSYGFLGRVSVVDENWRPRRVE